MKMHLKKNSCVLSLLLLISLTIICSSFVSAFKSSRKDYYKENLTPKKIIYSSSSSRRLLDQEHHQPITQHKEEEEQQQLNQKEPYHDNEEQRQEEQQQVYEQGNKSEEQREQQQNNNRTPYEDVGQQEQEQEITEQQEQQVYVDTKYKKKSPKKLIHDKGKYSHKKLHPLLMHYYLEMMRQQQQQHHDQHNSYAHAVSQLVSQPVHQPVYQAVHQPVHQPHESVMQLHMHHHPMMMMLYHHDHAIQQPMMTMMMDHHHQQQLLMHVPTSQLINLPEPDYRSFEPIPRKSAPNSNKVKDRFYSSNLLQDLGLIMAPKNLLRVTFPNGASLCLGNHLSFVDSMMEPTVDWRADDAVQSVVAKNAKKTPTTATKLYTIIMLDPDLPLTSGQFVHLLRVNSARSTKHSSIGQSVIPYIQPLPIFPAISSPASPYHRYVLLVFSQKKALDPLVVKEWVMPRLLSFKVTDFVHAFSLAPNPVAGNFFYGRLYVTRKVIC